jgi:hypothetical protein
VYLNEDLNEYLIVTRNVRGQISYEGFGFKGHAEDQSFIERFKPVNVLDIDEVEVQGLLSLCPDSVQEASTGFIQEGT